MQPVDLTTLLAVGNELQKFCLPARLEQVFQQDRHTLYLALRTLQGRRWLLLSWHPQGARLHLAPPPPKMPDTFTFSQQIWHQVASLALVKADLVSPWERVVDLQFAKRPDDPVLWHLYLEVMGKYSNAILVNAFGEIVTAAHQVSDQQSRVRPIQTGERYTLPPALWETIPDLAESFSSWQERLILLPQEVRRALPANYRGVSGSLVAVLCQWAGIQPTTLVTELNQTQWQDLFQGWRHWLTCLQQRQFAMAPHCQGQSYTVLPVLAINRENSVTRSENLHDNSLINVAINSETNSRTDAEITSQTAPLINEFLAEYYGNRFALAQFQQSYQQLQQALKNHLNKLNLKATDLRNRFDTAQQADDLKQKADLLMAYLHQWQLGMKEITVADFTTDAPVIIALDPTQNAVQNAQTLYKRHQKQKRATGFITPLLAETEQEIFYLEQVVTALQHLAPTDLSSLQEIRAELEEQGYIKPTAEYGGRSANHKNNKGTVTKQNTKQNREQQKRDEAPQCHRLHSPSGYEIWVGRNNYQNDLLTFRIANEYDLWFHSQEIAGSHVLLRLGAGSQPDDQDLQATADIAAYYSRARQSDAVPIVYTSPKYIHKPKGAKPGMVVYTHEKILWGKPAQYEIQI
ncbi:MAG: NFACT RNA binding domain-containing protein [Pseudanabaena sp. ELA607]